MGIERLGLVADTEHNNLHSPLVTKPNCWIPKPDNKLGAKPSSISGRRPASQDEEPRLRDAEQVVHTLARPQPLDHRHPARHLRPRGRRQPQAEEAGAAEGHPQGQEPRTGAREQEDRQRGRQQLQLPVKVHAGKQ